ncbi:DUF1295 domain-containing protein [Kordiimonas marina]|uniref:DUF1295 domain-containing protein n=1 Tax=Kordiimonas marina TaxID=2872312 RepID=UPI001FF4E108|nr:DUF1295 domain-containing protein [Kordiimonas marina]MCJ9427942.1 DUF1295 domain-containing protein [Kordiimonas marina]
MMDMIITASLVLFAVMLILWLISLKTGTVSFIDAYWGMGFVQVAAVCMERQVTMAGAEMGLAQKLYMLLLGLWALRLSAYLLSRYLADGEDKRYTRIIGARTGFRRHLFTLEMVFLLQGVLILLISAPTFTLMAAPARGLDAWVVAGALIWAVGIFFEWTGDWQLSRFRADPANAGKVLDRGVWAYTRHPNYFGDACMWWGLWLIGHDLYALYAPALMTFMLMKWSGVPLLERGLRKSRPGYEDYAARTSAFVPWPPKAVRE